MDMNGMDNFGMDQNPMNGMSGGMDGMTNAPYQMQSDPMSDPSSMTSLLTDPTKSDQPSNDNQVDQEIADMVTSRQLASQNWRDPYRLEWDQNHANYEQVYDTTGKEPWQSTTFQPMTTTFVERSTASLHNMSMGPETPGEFQARSAIDNDRIESTNELMIHDIERGKFKVGWTDFLRTLSLHGTAIGKIEYVKETAVVSVKERVKPSIPLIGGAIQSLAAMFGFGQGPQEKWSQQEMVTKDWATFKNVDLYNIYPQPGIEDFTKDCWVIEKFKITNKELLEGARNPDPEYQLVNITDELLMSGKSSVRNDPQTTQKRYDQGDHDVPVPSYDPDLEHEGFEYWGPAPIWMIHPELRQDDSKKYDVAYAWFWVIDGRWVVRKCVTPWRDALPPYIKGNYIRRAGQFYGIGNGKLLQGLQIEKNEIRNTRQDNINLLLNKIVGVLKDHVNKEDWDRLKSAPGAIWPFQGIDDIRKVLTPIEMPDITQDSWRSSAEVDREAQEATDVIKTTQTIGAGNDQAGNGTFRGQLLNQQTANERFMLYARMLEVLGLQSAILKMYERIYQFKSYEQIEKILGQKRAAKFELIPPEELPEIASWISLGALTNQNKGVALAQMRDWYLTFQNQPWVKSIDFARKWFRMGQMGTDPDEVMFSDEELQIYNEQKRMMLQGSMMNGTPPEPGAQPMTDDGMPMPGAPMGGMNGGGGPISGNVPLPMHGMPRPAMPARGPGASPFDGQGRPLS